MFAASKTAAAAAGTPPPSTDPQFNYVTMLLHGDGTNGAQNNTFVDSSTNNFTITRNGTPTQGSFSPYGDLWSNFFNGSNQSLSIASNSAFAFGTGNFTVEAWVYMTKAINAEEAVFDLGAVNSAGSFSIFRGANGAAGTWFIRMDGTGNDLSTSVSSSTLNSWTHLAVCKSGSTVTFYINGVAAVSGSRPSINITQSTPYIGQLNSFGYWWGGYISNLRVVKGTAVYTSAFTPSTTPLTAVSGTSLLTCQSNRFRDNSSNNFAITVTGTPSVQRFSPFDPAAEYSTSVIGGSGYFNGSSQYLTTGTLPALSGDFTFECWVYLNSSGQISRNFCTGNATGTPSFSMYNSGGRLSFGATNIAYDVFSTNAIPSLQWVHVAATRSGSTLRLFINGVNDGTATQTRTYTSGTGYVGGNPANGTQTVDGYISNLRLVTGTAVYTTTFTPPTAPLTAITNTSLLLNTVNAGIFDNAMMNDLVTVGDAKVSTAVKKYGTGSVAFDGTGDCLTTPDVGLFDFGTGDFTVEAWVNLSSFPASGPSIASGLGPNDGDWMFLFRSNTQLSWGRNHVAFDLNSSGVTFSTNTWYHIAVTKSAGTLRIFVDGVQRGSASNSQSYNVQNSLAVGARQVTRFVFGPGDYFPGYIDDLRITKGVARYTANFTPPTAAFPNN